MLKRLASFALPPTSTSAAHSMLTETFIASIGAQSNARRDEAGKDASVIIIEHQPVLQTKSSYKKSVTAPHCLAASASHIFAAQQSKAVVHVYNREKGSQEATVPFPEKITCIALACDDTVLLLGSAEGRIYLWEIASGRQVNTAQAHLQTITAFAVDSSSNYFISVSADATAQVWSLPSLLAFQTDVDDRTPVLTFDSHRTAIVSITLGRSNTHQNFTVTVSEDKTCMVWGYSTATILATFLLPDTPTAVTLDRADRALYVGYHDGSLQQIDLYGVAASGKSQMAIQPDQKKRWATADNTQDALLCTIVMNDSTSILTGHQSGAIRCWDAANGHVRSLTLHPPIPGPVTNLLLCPVTGLENSDPSSLKVPTIVKPKFGALDESMLAVPIGYAAQLEFTSMLETECAFRQALVSPSIPQSMLEGGLQELANWSTADMNGKSTTDDFMALDDPTTAVHEELSKENADLKQQLVSLRAVQMAAFDRMDKLAAERTALMRREQKRLIGAHNNNNTPADEDDEEY